jgi:hypothetical protein
MAPDCLWNEATRTNAIRLSSAAAYLATVPPDRMAYDVDVQD